jgi:hypothetical protein
MSEMKVARRRGSEAAAIEGHMLIVITASGFRL